MKIDLTRGAEMAHERQTDLFVSLRYVPRSLRDRSTVTTASVPSAPVAPVNSTKRSSSSRSNRP